MRFLEEAGIVVVSLLNLEEDDAIGVWLLIMCWWLWLVIWVCSYLDSPTITRHGTNKEFRR